MRYNITKETRGVFRIKEGDSKFTLFCSSLGNSDDVVRQFIQNLLDRANACEAPTENYPDIGAIERQTWRDRPPLL